MTSLTASSVRQLVYFITQILRHNRVYYTNSNSRDCHLIYKLIKLQIVQVIQNKKKSKQLKRVKIIWNTVLL